MQAIKVTITRYVSDEHPGFAECEFVDANGRCWHFIDKCVVLCGSYLDADSDYPQQGWIAGEVVSHRVDAEGREIIRFNTERPFGIDSVEGNTLFDVLLETLVEL